MDFDHRTAIVTGAATGIGLGIARRLAREGVNLAVVDVDGQGLKAAMADLVPPERAQPLVIEGDLTDPAVAKDVVAQTVAGFGRVDILVNNVGGGPRKPSLLYTEEDLRASVDVNLWTTIYTSLAVLPGMVEQGYGRIVNIGADSVRNGLEHHAIYNAGKGGVHGLTTGWAREFATRGVTVNTVAPAATLTETVAANPQWMAMLGPVVQQTIPMGRAATVEDVAAAAVFLCSDEAGFITGQVISVNGGSTML